MVRAQWEEILQETAITRLDVGIPELEQVGRD